jgi:hypothetical protein
MKWEDIGYLMAGVVKTTDNELKELLGLPPKSTRESVLLESGQYALTDSGREKELADNYTEIYSALKRYKAYLDELPRPRTALSHLNAEIERLEKIRKYEGESPILDRPVFSVVRRSDGRVGLFRVIGKKEKTFGVDGLILVLNLLKNYRKGV